MFNKVKRYLKVLLVVCLLVSLVITVPIVSKASENSDPVSVEITGVNEEYIEREEETEKIKSDAQISVEDLEETLENTDVVELETSEEVLEYLVNPMNLAQFTVVKPTSVDNSKSKYFPPIKNQGELNSCTTWSTVYYQMSYAVNRKLNRSASSEDNVFSPTWIYNMANEGENYGNFYSDILKILSEVGAVPMSKVPAVTTDEGDNVRTVRANKELWLEASKYRVDEYYTIDLQKNATVPVITSVKDKDLDVIKRALAVGEVLTGTTYSFKWQTKKIEAHEDVQANEEFVGEYIVHKTTGSSKGAHRITIVGYNDDIWVDINENGKVEEGEKGAFKIANSYGNTKHNKGFCWMSYDAVNTVSSVINEPDADRSAGLFDVIGFNVDLDTKDDEVYAVLTVSTNDLKSLNVKITAVDEDGKSFEYTPAPFTNALTRGMGEYPFNSGKDGDKGEFYIDLSNVIKNLKKKNIGKYTWKFEIADTSEENDIVIESLEFFTKADNSVTGSYINEPIKLSFNTANIKIDKEETSFLSLAQFF